MTIADGQTAPTFAEVMAAYNSRKNASAQNPSPFAGVSGWYYGREFLYDAFTPGAAWVNVHPNFYIGGLGGYRFDDNAVYEEKLRPCAFTALLPPRPARFGHPGVGQWRLVLQGAILKAIAGPVCKVSQHGALTTGAIPFGAGLTETDFITSVAWGPLVFTGLSIIDSVSTVFGPNVLIHPPAPTADILSGSYFAETLFFNTATSPGNPTSYTIHAPPACGFNPAP